MKCPTCGAEVPEGFLPLPVHEAITHTDPDVTLEEAQAKLRDWTLRYARRAGLRPSDILRDLPD